MQDSAQLMKEKFMLEKNLLHSLSRREYFEQYRRYLPRKSRLLPTTDLLLRDYKRYYDLYPDHTDIDFEEFSSLFISTWHNEDLPDEDLQFYSNNILPKLLESPDEEAEKSLIGLFNREFVDTITSCNADDLTPEKLQSELDRYQIKYESVFNNSDQDLKSLLDFEFEDSDYSGAIPYFLPTLQKNLKGMLPGSLIVINAASGAGKSAFVISQMVDTIKHLRKTGETRPVLHFSSEDHLPKLTRRIFSNLYASELPGGILDLQDKEVYTRIKDLYTGEYAEVPYKMCSIFEGMSVQVIKNKLQRHNPALCVIDITDVLVDRNKGNEALQFKLLYDKLRQLSIQYCPIIATTQAGATAAPKNSKGEKTYKLWLDSGDMYFSNEGGKDGAAETVIGVGMTDPLDAIRGIKIIKNKEGAGDVKFYCNFEGQYSRFSEAE
jgi:hypothetical protein